MSEECFLCGKPGRECDDSMSCSYAPPHMVNGVQSPNKPALTVVQLRQSPSLTDIPGQLRQMAADIERGTYGVVGEVALVLMGDTLEVFGWGQLRDPTSSAAMLAAGHMRLVAAVERHGRE